MDRVRGSRGYLQTSDLEKARPLLREAAFRGREPASRFLYLRFGEKTTDNIALELDKSFEEQSKIRNMNKLKEKLSDPLVIAGIIVVLSGVLGVAAYDPDMPEDERNRREQQWLHDEADRKEKEAAWQQEEARRFMQKWNNHSTNRDW
jgi:hypothetical protein